MLFILWATTLPWKFLWSLSVIVLACSLFFLGCHLFYILPYSSLLLDSCLSFSQLISVSIPVLHVHWMQFVGRFWCIISHLAPPPCLLSVCPYTGIVCNSLDKGWHSSCMLLLHLQQGSYAPVLECICSQMLLLSLWIQCNEHFLLFSFHVPNIQMRMRN